jgi:hypothetical protein
MALSFVEFHPLLQQLQLQQQQLQQQQLLLYHALLEEPGQHGDLLRVMTHVGYVVQARNRELVYRRLRGVHARK